MGAEHTLTLSSTGDIYAWGSNSEGQVRPDTPPHHHHHHHNLSGDASILGCRPARSGPHQPRPGTNNGDGAPGETRPPGVCRALPQRRLDRPLAAPTCPRWEPRTRQTLAPLPTAAPSSPCSPSSSSGSSVPLQLGLPVAVPPQYSGLKEVSVEALRARLRLLYHFSDLMYSSWRLLNLSPNNQVGAGAPAAASARKLPPLEQKDGGRAARSVTEALWMCVCAELYVPLQCRDLGHRPGPAEAPAGPQSLHAAHGALHRKDHGAGQELRPPDHRETDLHPVRRH